MLAPSAQGPSHSWPSSAPDLGAAAEGEDGAEAASRAEKDVPDPSLAIHGDITVTRDVPSQPPPHHSIVGVANADLSKSSLVAEYREDHPPHPSRGKDDIV